MNSGGGGGGYCTRPWWKLKLEEEEEENDTWKGPLWMVVKRRRISQRLCLVIKWPPLSMRATRRENRGASVPLLFSPPANFLVVKKEEAFFLSHFLYLCTTFSRTTATAATSRNNNNFRRRRLATWSLSEEVFSFIQEEEEVGGCVTFFFVFFHCVKGTKWWSLIPPSYPWLVVCCLRRRGRNVSHEWGERGQVMRGTVGTRQCPLSGWCWPVETLEEDFCCKTGCTFNISLSRLSDFNWRPDRSSFLFQSKNGISSSSSSFSFRLNVMSNNSSRKHNITKLLLNKKINSFGCARLSPVQTTQRRRRRRRDD